MLKKSKFFGILVFSFLFTGLIFAFKTPLLFKYAETMVFVDDSEWQELVSIAPSMLEAKELKLRELAFQIQFQPDSQQINDINFVQKFQQSIVEGNGNCSNHISSIAWYLLTELDTDDFNIVHFYSKQSFTKGFGHSALDAGGIYDIFEGGIWSHSDNSVVTLADILSSSSLSDQQEFQIKNLNPNRKNKTKNYVAGLLDANFIGVTPAKSYDQYIKFIDSIYVPFKDKKIEKYFYDGLALFFGVLPVVYLETKKDQMIMDNALQLKLAKLWIFSVRVMTILFLLWFLKKIYRVLIQS